MKHQRTSRTRLARTKLRGAPALAALALGLASAHASPAHGPGHDTAHRASWGARAAAPHSAGRSSVILKLAPGGLTEARQAALAHLGAGVTRRLGFIGSVAVTVPRAHLARVAALPFVTHLSLDGQVHKCDEFTCASSGADTAYQQYGLTGQGVTVAVVDSGITSSRDMGGASRDGGGSRDMGGSSWNGRLLGAISFVPGDSSTDDACGHGTHVAGIVAGTAPTLRASGTRTPTTARRGTPAW